MITLSVSCSFLTAFSTDPHNALMGIWMHWSKQTEVMSLHLCSSIQLETDLVEVKEELMLWISPAVTWGRKEEKKKQERS